MNQLYFGDCLNLLKELDARYPNGLVDLVYIDPPYCSGQNFPEFSDTWSRVAYDEALAEIHLLNPALWSFIDNPSFPKSTVSYLTNLGLRTYFMHRVLKNSGSFYLHCDQTMSHYIKIILDLIFGAKFFRGEIIWKRTTSNGSNKVAAKRYPVCTDSILFYTKSDIYTFNREYRTYKDSTLKRYDQEDEGGAYLWANIKNASQNKIDELKLKHELKEFESGFRYKKYLDLSKGSLVNNLWLDIHPYPIKKQRTYSTQKPESLIERIIAASSKKGDLVADFYAGSGTTAVVAQRMKRKWLAVDSSEHSIKIIKEKLEV